MAADERTTGELGRSIDQLASAVEALRLDVKGLPAQIERTYARKDVMTAELHSVTDDVADLQRRDRERSSHAASTRRLVLLALFSALVLTPMSTLLLSAIQSR